VTRGRSPGAAVCTSALPADRLLQASTAPEFRFDRRCRRRSGDPWIPDLQRLRSHAPPTSRLVACDPRADRQASSLLSPLRSPMSHAVDPWNFKFHFLNDQGQQTSMFRKKGSFDGETLLLDSIPIPASGMLQTVVRENRMIIVYLTADGGPGHLMIMPAAAKDCERLKRQLDIARSSTWARIHRESLQKAGRGGAYRDAECPHCTATVVLSDMPSTPQLYCHFCDTLSTVDGSAKDALESKLRICDECGMFSQPVKFTIFYFWFALVVYGWWNKTTWRCPACMRGEAWKMLFGNLIFLLGVPVAIVQLIRSYSGAVVGGAFKGLDGANLRARKGDVVGALGGYKAILERVPHSAGIKYNLGLALLQQDEHRRAADTFQLALGDCANYAPAYRVLKGLYAKLGDRDRLKALEAMWDDVREAEQADDATAT